VLAALMFGAAFLPRRGKEPAPMLWPKIAAAAFLPGVMIGWTLEAVPIESYTVGTWLRSLALAATAAAAPIVCAAACAANRPLPTFASLLGRSDAPRDKLASALGGIFIVLVLLAVQAALGLVFDPRYRDFPFAPLTTAVVPFLVLSLSTSRPQGPRAAAETLAAAVLAVAALYIAPNESFANWQALWFCLTVLALSFILLRARAAPD
jgi:hypothetical protein